MNIGSLSADCMALYPRKHNSSCLWWVKLDPSITTILILTGLHSDEASPIPEGGVSCQMSL